MKKELYDKWIKALESGEYKRIPGRLRRAGGKEGYCCLGVLRDVCAKDLGVDYLDLKWGKEESFNEQAQKTVGLSEGDIEDLIFINDHSSKGRDYTEVVEFLRQGKDRFVE